MKFFKFSIVASLLFTLILLLNQGFKINNRAIPPLGKILDPVNGVLANAESDDPQMKKVLKMPGLQDEVHLYWDDRMVPHIFASNTADAFFAQGYVTAYMRLWQMDFQTRAAAGRLSEVLYPTLGENVLRFDRLQRRNGMLASAKKSAENMLKDPETAMVLQAYTDGVNAYIDRLNYRDYPIEYKILNYAPEKWSPLKCALLLKYMAQMLTDNDLDLGIANAYSLLNADDADFLYAVFPENFSDPIIPSGTHFDFENRADSLSQLVEPVDSLAGFYPALENVNYFEGIGSNNWAVNGDKSASQGPILCNDPHLALNLPSIWFEIQISTPLFNVYGASLPGSPCVISGFNENIAWGVTNGTRDVRDWYRVEWKDESKAQYKYDGRWYDTEYVYDTIYIKGRREPLIDQKKITIMGPVVYEDSLMKGGLGKDLAMFWTAFIDANELKTFIQMNKAKNHNDYLDALQYFGAPAQNFVFAAANGDIAIKQQGYHLNYPEDYGYGVRNRLISDVIPSENNPHILNPERGFVSSANQHPTDSTYPYYYNGIFESYRNKRVNELLEANNGMTTEFMKSMQGDNKNLLASEYLPFFLKHVSESDFGKHKDWFDLLQKWNYFNDAEQIAPSIFEAWFVAFKKMTYDEWDNFKGEINLPPNKQLFNLMRKNANASIFDIQSTPEKENAGDLILQSLAFAMADLEKKETEKGGLEWYKYKGTSVQHILQIKPFGRYDIKVGGNYSIVNACSDRWGPSWKMIVAFEGNQIRAYGIYPGGQSGNPGSRFYDNMIEDWAAGKYYSLQFFRDREEAENALSFYQKLMK